jgi:uncharacterized protein
MRMKNIITTKTIFLLLVIVNFFNCNQKIQFKFQSGFEGGTYFKIGESLKTLDSFQIESSISKGSQDNINAVHKGLVDFSIAQLDVLQNTSLGDPNIKEKVKVLFPIYAEEIHLITKKDINFITDLKNKKISIGDSESGTKLTSIIFLNYFGIDSDSSELIEKDYALSLKDISEGNLDAMILVAGTPITLLKDLGPEISDKIHLISFEKEKLANIKNSNLVFQRSEIPASTYSWEVKPIETIQVQSVLICRSDLPEDTVVKFVKTIWKNKDSLSTQHEKWKKLDKNQLNDHLKRNPDIFHPSISKIVGDL